MYLKSITLKGFKSFVDRTRLEFTPGTSVIVGPNGSGKSNVTDAVLWALGEQSPVAVRGQSMQDVIFAGGPGRQAAASATVELVLDDSENALGMGSEISIVRRLDRGGDGEYRLGGARCRLIDVIELLSDTGLGKEMHSVISQGRVDQVVTSKPHDRRRLIEEAAGLGKHRKRRRRAQIKLDHTQDNLDRALDVEREARARLRPLKRQAEAAEHHARLHRQTLEVRWELAREELRARLAELATATEAAVKARAVRTELEGELAQVGARRRAAEEALAARSSHREELSRRRYAARSAAERIEFRLEAMRGSAATVAERLAADRERLRVLRAQAEADRPDPEAEGRVAAMRRELEALERDRQAELARQLETLERERVDAATAEQACEQDVAAAAQTRATAEAAHEAARAAVREAEQAVEAARRESARVGGELAAVNQFLRSHGGAPGGAQALADALTVAPGYELAVAAALDGRLGAAVATGREEALALLAGAGRDGGRVLILPTSSELGHESVGGGAAGDGAAAGRAAGDGAAAEGAAGVGPHAPAGAEHILDHVSDRGKAAALARVLLHDTWVVEDLEALPTDFSGVAVTRAGRVFAPAARELRQAPAIGEERVLAERNHRDELIALSERAIRAEHAARDAVRTASERANQLEGEREAAVSGHRSAVRRRDEAAEAERRVLATLERRRRAPDEGTDAGRRAQLHAEIRAEEARAERGVRERAERSQRIDRLAARSASDETLAPAIASIIEATVEVGAAIAERCAAFDAELAADDEAGAHVTAELRECAGQEASLHGRLQVAGEALTSCDVRAQRAEDQQADARTSLSELAGELALDPTPAPEPMDETTRADLCGRLERLRRRHEQLGPVNPLAADEYREALEHVEELEGQRSDLETALRELGKLIRDTDCEIRQSFEETFASAAANFEELAARLFPGGGGRLRLVSERDDQPRVIGGGSTRAGDGDASEPEDAPGAEEFDLDAESDEDAMGVEIEITSGRATKRLSLLSGGEKSMTALAFLFAVFLAKPCPFYILDEVEAALDDLNIARFLDLVATYADRAQFIVVTHQKRTMDAADALYGVSMGADGVSKVISRRLPAREKAA